MAAKPDLRTRRYESMDDGIQVSTQVATGHSGLMNITRLPVAAASQPPTLPPSSYSEAPLDKPIGSITPVEGSTNPVSSIDPRLSSVALNNPPLDTSPFSLSNPLSEFRENFPRPLQNTNRHNFNFLIGAQIPRILSTLPPSTKQLIHYVIDQYERVLDSVYFSPNGRQISKMREMVITRLQTSSITRCAAILVAKIIESMLNGDSHRNRATLHRSIERFESQLLRVKTQQPNLIQVQYLLNECLEAALLKMRLSDSHYAYRLFRDAAPTFLGIAYSDPTLWPDPNGPPTICLSKVATSAQFELGHFALMDNICSMTYGVPQVVDYETATHFPEEVHPIEWVHCFPLEFQLSIAEINQCLWRSCVAPDWRAIEQRLLSYKTPLITMDCTESWKNIARIAVVESWRQVLLIYLYMALCGASSDDPRVQSGVRQTFQLFNTVKGEDPPKVNVHFMIQYLIAGACTRNEKQRSFVRERLLDASDSNKFWLLPGSELVPVLDHLWHGAAANGQPFKWSDYLISRQKALPILL